MIFNIDNQDLTDSSNLSETELEPVNFVLVKNHANSSLVNNIVYTILADSFDFSNFILNYLSNIAQNLQKNCIEASFEFKIFIILLSALLIILVGISIVWRFLGDSIDQFYKDQEYYTQNTSNNSQAKAGLFEKKTK